MRGEITKKTGYVLIVILFLCITALYFYPVVFSGKTLASRDMYAFFYPRQLYAAQCIKSGILPLWNPHLASGVPFLANLQSSIFYPLSLIYYILPFDTGFKYFIVFHYYLAGLWMFLLMRHWKYDDYASIFAALAFMFGGYMISILDNVAFLTAAVWLPLIVLWYDRFLSEGKRLYLILAGVGMALQILGGDASVYVLSTFLFLMVYHLYRVSSTGDRRWGGMLRSLRCIVYVGIIAVLLSAVVLIPFLEYVYHSTRIEGFSYEEMTKWSYHPLELFQLFVPYLYGSTVPMCRWFGQLWLDTFYLGITSILMVILCLRWQRNGLPYFLIWVVIGSLLMAFGKYTPLFSIIRHIPGFNMIHYPVKYLFLAAFSLSLLAGIGFSLLFDKAEKRETKGLDRFLLVINGMAIGILISAMLLDDKLFKVFQDAYPQTLFYKIITAEAAYLTIFKGYAVFVLLLIATSFLIMVAARRRTAAGVAKVTVMMMLLLDLAIVGKPQDALIDSEAYSKPNEVIEFLKKDVSHYRILSLSYSTFEGFMHIPNVPFAGTFETLKAFMMPNLSLLFGIDSVDEYAEMLVTRYYALFYPVKQFFRNRNDDAVSGDFCRQMLNLLNVKYLISSYPLDKDTLKLEQVRGGTIKIYENKNVLPRAFFVSNASVYTDDDGVLKAMRKPDFDPRSAVLLTRNEYHKLRESAAGEKSPHANIGAVEVKILKYSPNHVEIETIGNDKGFLVLADNYYPGWNAFVNGRKKNIVRAYYNFRGVYLPPGHNKVIFTFDSLSFEIGALISCSAFLGMLLLLVTGRGDARVVL